MPRVRPNPKPEAPKKEPLPPAPDVVDWKETECIALAEEAFNEADLFARFTNMDGIAETKPVMIYFYWPEEDAEDTDKDIANMARRSVLMDEILTHEDIRRASVNYHCFKSNAKGLLALHKSEYNLKIVPKVLFFDTKGKKVWQLTNTKANPTGVAKKMEKILHDVGCAPGGGGCAPGGGAAPGGG